MARTARQKAASRAIAAENVEKLQRASYIAYFGIYLMILESLLVDEIYFFQSGGFIVFPANNSIFVAVIIAILASFLNAQATNKKFWKLMYGYLGAIGLAVLTYLVWLLLRIALGVL